MIAEQIEKGDGDTDGNACGDAPDDQSARAGDRQRQQHERNSGDDGDGAADREFLHACGLVRQRGPERAQQSQDHDRHQPAKPQPDGPL